MNPVNSPSRNRQSGRVSRESAMRSGVKASGANHGTPRLCSAGLGKVRTRSAAESSASAKLSSDSGGFFIHLIGHVRAADQRAAEHHFESDGEAVLAITFELSGRHVGCNRQVAAHGLQILADGGNVDVATIGQYLQPDRKSTRLN